ncbi:hypothetical protein ABIA65_005370, partial [Mycolicibacterium sp. 624]
MLRTAPPGWFFEAPGLPGRMGEVTGVGAWTPQRITR